MAAAHGHVFHVEFGINDTELTRALEVGNYAMAKKLIVDNAHTSYLDEGCYQKIPLYIVLSGSIPRNFHIAKLLAQYGANVNNRVPETEFGAEYLSPGKTALELLIDLYTQLTLHSSHVIPDNTQDDTLFDFDQDMVIGMNGAMIRDEETLLEEVCEMIFIMLSHGGDCNIRDEHNMTLLHRVAILSTDDRVLHLLCESGADLNALDVRRNTPLMALCAGFPFGAQHFLEDRDIICSADEEVEGGCNPQLDCCNISGKEHFLDYLLSLRDTQLQLDAQNRQGHTALFNCMVRGDLHSSLLLLQHGCDPSLRGRVLEQKQNGLSSLSVSPLFAALCSYRVVRYHCENVGPTTPCSYQFLAHLVDAGYFLTSAITRELQEYMEHFDDFSAFKHLKDLGTRLVQLMFGATTCSLRQLASRVVFQCCRPPGLSDLGQLVEQLNLPKDTLICLHVELFRQLFCWKFRQLRWFRIEERENNEIGLWGAGLSDSESDSNGGDSDLEYW